jgi:RNA polymerase sigma-54 factor
METRQLQTQKLAPKMIQSMEILQLPILALQERVEQELSENPMLEVQDVDPNLPDEPEEEEVDPNRQTEDEKELVVKDNQTNEEDFERLANMDNDMPESFDDFRTSSNRMQEAQDRQHDLMANALERPESLNDYLIHQLAEMKSTTTTSRSPSGSFRRSTLATVAISSPAFATCSPLATAPKICSAPKKHCN